jgi:hypothetical protein
MKILVTGGRGYRDRARVFAELDRIHAKEPIRVLIHGAGGGLDLLGEQWAKAREVAYRGYPAEWNKHGAPAGPRRNERMLCLEHDPPESRIDLVVAFPGGKGTADMVRRARAANIPIEEIT